MDFEEAESERERGESDGIADKWFIYAGRTWLSLINAGVPIYRFAPRRYVSQLLLTTTSTTSFEKTTTTTKTTINEGKIIFFFSSNLRTVLFVAKNLCSYLQHCVIREYNDRYTVLAQLQDYGVINENLYRRGGCRWRKYINHDEIEIYESVLCVLHYESPQ